MRQATGSARGDLVVVLPERRRKSNASECAVMLARILPTGEFELLTAAAWARALGYAPQELEGRSLRDLMDLEAPTAQGIVDVLLDESDIQPLDITLRCKDQRRKSCILYRRFDSYAEAVFVMADERPA